MNNKTKHTPGPWHVVRGPEMVGVHAAECVIYHAPLDPELLPETHARQHADARLIAAAPELLEALQDALGYNDRAGGGFPWAASARAAIAKAEGRGE